jgi:hypothetical protein
MPISIPSSSTHQDISIWRGARRTAAHAALPDNFDRSRPGFDSLCPNRACKSQAFWPPFVKRQPACPQLASSHYSSSLELAAVKDDSFEL